MLAIFLLVVTIIPNMILGLSIGASTTLMLQVALAALLIVIWPIAYLYMGGTLRVYSLIIWILLGAILPSLCYF